MDQTNMNFKQIKKRWGIAFIVTRYTAHIVTNKLESRHQCSDIVLNMQGFLHFHEQMQIKKLVKDQKI